MSDDRRIPLISIIILILVLVVAVGFFILRKESLISPVPEEADVKVIFTSPIPTETPVPVTPTPSGGAKNPSPTKKITVTTKPTASVTKAVTPSPVGPTVTEASGE